MRPVEPARLRFSKLHGAGNDFVLIDLRDGSPPPSPALCRALADRHTGVGCDQILTVEPPRSRGALAAYGVFNADGTRAGQCGNGARCVAEWLQRDGSAQASAFVLDSPSGTHHVQALSHGCWRIAMGMPRFGLADIPLLGVDGPGPYTLAVEGTDVQLGAVSMGNPHAVIEVASLDAAPVATLGAALQRHRAFPDSVNVGFAQVIDQGRIALRVYERGAGETLACGSGACAAVAVLARAGRVARDVEVILPGGMLRIEWPGDDAPISMSGPATHVFDGQWQP